MRLPKFRFTIKGIQQERKTVIIASVLVLALVAVLSVGLFLVFRKPVYEEELNREAGSDARVVSQEASVAVGDALNVAAEPVVTNITTEEEEERQAAIATVESEYQRLGIVQCSSYINFRTKPDQNDLTNIQGMLANGAAVDILDDAPEGTDGWRDDGLCFKAVYRDWSRCGGIDSGACEEAGDGCDGEAPDAVDAGNCGG